MARLFRFQPHLRYFCKAGITGLNNRGATAQCNFNAVIYIWLVLFESHMARKLYSVKIYGSACFEVSKQTLFTDP